MTAVEGPEATSGSGGMHHIALSNPVHLIKNTYPPRNKETSVAFFLIGGP